MMKALSMKAILIAFAFMIIISMPVFARIDDGGADGAGISDGGISTSFPETDKIISSGYMWKVFSVWSTIVSIVQILAFAAIIFAGLRYMFASADQKADIKRSLGILAIGAILVFATSTIIKFVVGAGEEIIK